MIDCKIIHHLLKVPPTKCQKKKLIIIKHKSDQQEQSVVSGPWEMVDAFSSDSSQSLRNMSKKENSYLLNRKLPLAVSGNKVQQVSVNTLASEVINQDAIAHRTRRRKT